MVLCAEKLRVKPELVAEFSVAHKTDVHSVLMNDLGNVRTGCLEEEDSSQWCH